MAMKSAEMILKNWLEGMQSGRTKQKYREGIEAVTENPMQKAAEAEELYLRKVEESVRSGRRREKLLAVPLARWKQNASVTGSERLGTGAVKAQDKARAAYQKFAPIYAEAASAAAAIPKDGTEATALAKVAAAMQVLKRGAGKL